VASGSKNAGLPSKTLFYNPNFMAVLCRTACYARAQQIDHRAGAVLGDPYEGRLL